MVNKLYIKTFGCQMNEYDSDKILEIFHSKHKTERTEKSDFSMFLHYVTSGFWLFKKNAQIMTNSTPQNNKKGLTHKPLGTTNQPTSIAIGHVQGERVHRPRGGPAAGGVAALQRGAPVPRLRPPRRGGGSSSSSDSDSGSDGSRAAWRGE